MDIGRIVDAHIHVNGMTHGMLIAMGVKDSDLCIITSAINRMIECGTPKEQIVKYVLKCTKNS